MGKIQLTFDKQGNIEIPTMVLCRQNCSRIGAIPNIQNFVFADNFGNAAEFSFTVYKNQCSSVWSAIKDFRNIYVPEWNTFFQLKVDLNESSSISKSITATHLAEVELSNVLNPALEIYTDTDIDLQDKDDPPTTFCNFDYVDFSAIHRILKVAVNYEVDHVDESLYDLRPSISETNQYVYDTYVNLGSEINCHFEFDVFIDKETGKIRRTVSAYDLESVCNDCGCRDEFNVKCPDCGSTNFTSGYGTDTTIFVSAETLADNITFTTDTSNVKNAFYLEAGDEDMTAAIINCNPNGTQWLWYFSPQDQEDMSRELWNKLYSESDVESEQGYYQVYDYYQNDYVYTEDIKPATYNELCKKYNELCQNEYDKDSDEIFMEEIEGDVVGYPALVNAYYNETDALYFLTNSLMPSIDIACDTSAKEQEAMLREHFASNPVAVNVNSLGEVLPTQANSAVSSMAEALIDSRYKVKISEYSFEKGASSGTWKFQITNYSSEDDIYTSETAVTIAVNTKYEEFVKQKVQKVLEKGENKNYGISALMESDKFEEELHLYGLVPLQTILKCVTGVLATLADMDVTKDSTDKADLYQEISVPYTEKESKIQAEIAVRQAEIDEITMLNTRIDSVMKMVHTKLNIEAFLGEDLWKELNIYRRESTFSNTNYITAETNAETISNAKRFIEAATKELVKSATLQHSISSSFKNLMNIKEFQALRKHFAVGNWIRIQVDEEVYKLRLLSYQLDFGDYQNMNVEFSDVTQINDDYSDLRSVVENAKTMGKTYSTVEKQALEGQTSYKLTKDWTQKGLDATLTQIVNNAANQTMVMDEYGMIFRRQLDSGDGYDPEQMRIINSTLAITKNGWQTLSTAVGKFLYEDPDPNSETYGQMVTGYGINAETIIGNVILGNSLGIHTVKDNDNECHLTMDSNGLTVTNKTNTFTVNPNATSILTISKSTENVIYFDSNGNAHFKGHIDATSLTLSGDSNLSSSDISGMDSYIQKDQTISMNGSSFTVSSAGLLTAENAVIYGAIHTGIGDIGGWTIDTSRIYDNTSTNKAGINKSGNGQAFWAGGTDLTGNSASFRVSHDGKLYASNVEISGGSITVGNNFSVDSSGNLSATNASITGNVDATTINVKSVLNMYTNSENASSAKTILSFTQTGHDNYRTLKVGENCNYIIFGDWFYIDSLNHSFNIYKTNEDDGEEIFGCYKDSIYCNVDLHCENIYAWAAYNNELNSTYAINARIGDDARIRRVTSSSGRYKNIISNLSSSDIEKMYDIPTYWFTYKDGYIDKEDPRYNIPIPGFVVEDWMDIMPIAIDLKDGLPEMWNNNIVVPLMFEMIKNDHKEIEQLKEQIVLLTEALKRV